MKTEFMATIIVETKGKKLNQKEVEKIRKWLQKGLTVDEETYEKFPINRTLFDFPKATSVASPGTTIDASFFDSIPKGRS